MTLFDLFFKLVSDLIYHFLCVETSAMTGFNVELLFRKIAKDLYVEDLDRQRQNEDSDIDDEERNDRKIVKVLKTITKQKKAIPNRRNTCKCS